MRETGVDSRSILADRGTFGPVADGLKTRDPLGWPGYGPPVGDSTTTPDESVAAGPARIGGHEIELAEFRFDFMGGSMGWVAGERLARAMERASERAVPFVLRSATGGARMQEGMVALVQMPKMVAARARLAHANSPFVVLFGDPTTGGVLASLGGLADISFAEVGATLGFAGPRVAEHFTGRSLSPSSHTAEAAFGNGMVDSLVAPEDAPKLMARTLGVLAPDTPQGVSAPGPSLETEGGAWDVVQRARAPERPTGRSLIAALSDETVDLKGDRAGHDDPGTVCAIGRLGGRKALLIATDRARSPGPGAFRKVVRCIGVAERLGLPVVTLIDTPGADPSEGSEAHGIAWSIARCLDALLGAEVPVLAVVAGEGGSGGALALAVGDVLLACDGSIFSVMAPEAAATILWRDAGRGPDAADLLKPTAGHLVELGIADSLIPSPVGAESFRAAVTYHLAHLIDSAPAGEDLPKRRRQRWRDIGE